ncbi:MAG: MFS transporter [Spirochaetaceae bacterium]|jgi:DHA3 family macrolide efflux protein-like MFS transporter|nr:MFS transporter [Spirochaetaceae bacterium]
MEINWKKNTALFMAGQALSLFGSMVTQYAILWHITLKTQSGAMMTLFTIAGFLPMFFISPFGGVWADRFNKKYIINIADGSIAFASLVVALFLLAGFDNFGLLLLCAVVRSLGQGVHAPAFSSFIPALVPPEHLTRVNGIQGSIQSLTMLAAPVISGALMTFAPLASLFFLDVITAAIGIAILFFFVKVPPRPESPSPAAARVSAVPEPPGEGIAASSEGLNYFRDLGAGLRYIRKNGYIFRMIVIAAIFMFLTSPMALLTPLQVTRDFGVEVWRLTAIEITFSLGMMAGGILIGLWGGFKNKTVTLALACVLFGIEAAALGLVPNFFVYIGIMAAAGMTIPLYNTPATVLLQSTVDPAFMGRVFSVHGMVSSVMLPLGMLLFGPLADVVAIDLLLIGTGAGMMLLSIPFMVSKTLRAAGALTGRLPGRAEPPAENETEDAAGNQ